MMWQSHNPKHFWDLLAELTKREIKARYKQSILGYAWVILVPILNLIVLTVVFSYFIRVPTGGTPYVIFLFTGLVPWTFTANSISSATQSVVSNTSLITKIYLPREIFPIATILAKMVDFLLTCLVLIVLLIIFKVPFRYTMLFIPVIFFFHFLLVLGISFFLSAVNVFFRDVENVIGVFLTIWMYVTPVLYPQELIPPRLVPFFNLNPMMPIINAYRNTILYGRMPPWQSFTYAIGISVLIFVLGYKFFKNRARYFADVI
jgi:ABC-2 type transport system permease protein